MPCTYIIVRAKSHGNALAHYRRPRGVRLLLLYHVFFRVLCFHNRVVMTIALRRPRSDRHGFHTTLGGGVKGENGGSYIMCTLHFSCGMGGQKQLRGYDVTESIRASCDTGRREKGENARKRLTFCVMCIDTRNVRIKQRDL